MVCSIVKSVHKPAQNLSVHLTCNEILSLKIAGRAMESLSPNHSSVVNIIVHFWHSYQMTIPMSTSLSFAMPT